MNNSFTISGLSIKTCKHANTQYTDDKNADDEQGSNTTNKH